MVFIIAINYSSARQNFKRFCDKVSKDFEIIVITRKNGDNVVMLSEQEYNNLIENLYVRKSISHYEELMQSISQLTEGKGRKRELIDE